MPAAMVTAFAKKPGKTAVVVEKLWKSATALAVDAGRKEDFSYITGILKRMLRIEAEELGEGQISPDYPLLLETWGTELTTRMLAEAMPSSIKAALMMRWLEVEKQLRNVPSGNVSWPTLARSLRQGVYTFLNWLTQDRPEERHKKFTGII